MIAVDVGARTVGMPGEHVRGQHADVRRRHLAIAVHVARHRGGTRREYADEGQGQTEHRADSAPAAGERTNPLADASLSHGFRPTRHQHSNIDEFGQKYATRDVHAIGVLENAATPYLRINAEHLLHKRPALLLSEIDSIGTV
jgi:hypothetical protein